MRREQEAAPDERMERLRSRKQQIEGQLDERRAAARFEPEPDADIDIDSLEMDEHVRQPTTSSRDKSKTEMTPAEAEEDTYTSRLLKAKRKVWDENNPDK